jgi:hypothetical protein
MRFGSRRVLPLVFLAFSLLYLAFGFSLQKLTMIGDEQGWDPGSRALPLGAGFLMLGLSVYLVFRETTRTLTEQAVPSGAQRLILLTIVVSLLYILVFRTLGFILSTHILLFTLIYFNQRQDVRTQYVAPFAAGLVPSTVFVLLVYTAGRFVTRGMSVLGRSSGTALLSNKSFASLVVFLLLAGLFALVVVALRRPRRRPSFRQQLLSALTAAGMTELLYLVFKQIFLVNLARGIVAW